MISDLQLHKYSCSVLLITLTLVLTMQTAYAQDYVFRHITTRSGIAGGYIDDIIQDDHGFIWFATSTGLGKYDGFAFTNYRSDVEFIGNISNNDVNDLHLLAGNRLLVAHGQGIDLMDMETELFYPLHISGSLPPFGSVTTAEVDENGDLWVISGQNFYYFPDADFEADTLRGSAYTKDLSEGFLFRDIESYRGEVWLGSTDGLFVFNPSSRVMRQITSSIPEVLNVLESSNWEILEGPDGNLYLSYENGLLRYNQNTKQLEKIIRIGSLTEEQLNSTTFQDLMVDAGNNLWIGTGTLGAYKWNLFTDEFTEFRPDDRQDQKVNSADIHYIFEDSQSNIWFGYHFLGVSLMYSQSWNYSFQLPFPDLPADDPRNITRYVKMDQNSILWGVTGGGVIRGLGTENATYYVLPDSLSGSETSFLSFIYHFTDEYLILNQENEPRIILFDKSTETYSSLDTPEGEILTPIASSELENNLYFSTFAGPNILALNLQSLEFETYKAPLINDVNAAALVVSQAEFIYEGLLYTKHYFLGLPNGGVGFETFVLDPETGTFEPHKLELGVSLAGIQPPHISRYQTGITYYNLSAGLAQVNSLSGEVNVFFEDQIPLLREGTGLMTEDEQGYIWMNNQTGLIRLDPLTESISYFEVPPSKQPTSYALQSTLTNGDVIFPGAGGYILFNPSELEMEQPVGKTIITSLQSGNQQYNTIYASQDEIIEIESDQNNLTFNFIGTNFRDPTSTRYRYRVLGSENEQWNEVENQRSVFIPNLPGGRYTFEVQSGSQFGSFNEAGATLSFAILPPWWNTIPAYLMYFLLLGGFVYGADRFQRKRVLQKERERSREKELQQARKIESAYHELEKAHEQLKSAQVQLVQQEKLASLGQLTAGIAHEIKNPLNFVNNFSDVSIELIEEARDEIKDKLPTDGQLLKDILADIETNIRKIHKHGKRADGIVKSMLQHSRGGNTTKETKDINALVKEYVNLSFHGMRAGSRPINVDISMHLDDKILPVPVIAEDFSRVIVNLCNNSFDALREKANKKHEAGEPFNPALTVRTEQSEKGVRIRIIDNGPGIPEEVMDKIMQPFFTTKKGTEGTGLGLSISNDIIKAHGGELEVSSSEKEGTIFTINLFYGD